MSAHVNLFIDAIRSDDELKREVGISLDAETENEAYEAVVRIAASKGFNVTREELEAALEEIELTDDELEVVAGGKGANCN